MPIDIFLKRLMSGEIFVLDGGLASELERCGGDLSSSLWSADLLLENPALIEKVHVHFLQSGCNIITTSSYQATFQGFAKKGISREMSRKLLHTSVELAKSARDTTLKDATGSPLILIAASIGPYGAYLADGSEYRGDYNLSLDDLKEFHRERLSTLIECEPDLIAFETIPCLTEAKALIELLSEFPNVRAWISFSCRDGMKLSNGELFSDAVRLVASSKQIIAVGVNCTQPGYISSLLNSAQEAINKEHQVFIVYPNSGELWNDEKKQYVDTGNMRKLWEYVTEWKSKGVGIIGGCCRTYPSDIKKMVEVLLPSTQ